MPEICLPFVLFSYFTASAYPTLPPGDSAEFVTAVDHFGIPHPPGYPLYLLVGRVFATLFPFGNIAYRLNLLSAILGVASAYLLFLALRRMNVRPWPAFLGISVALTVPAFVESAHSTEVFTLNTVFLTGLIYLMIRQVDDGEGPLACRRMYLSALLLGLGLCNHQTLVFAVPVLLAAYRPLLRARPASLLYCSGFFLLGFSAQFVILLRGLQHPSFTMAPARTIGELVDILLRKRYGTFSLQSYGEAQAFTGIAITKRLSFLFETIYSDLGIAGSVLVLPGVWFSLRNGVKRGILLLLIFLFMVVGFFAISNVQLRPEEQVVLQRFMLPAFLLCGVWIALALNELGAFIERWSSIANVVAFVAAFAGIAFLRGLHTNRREYFYLTDLMRNVERCIQKNSVVIMGADDNLAFVSLFNANVLRRRTDVARVSWFRSPGILKVTIADRADIIPGPTPGTTGTDSLERVIAWNLAQGRHVYLFENVPDLIVRAEASFIVENAGMLNKLSMRLPAERRSPKIDMSPWQLYVQRGALRSADAPDLRARYFVDFNAKALSRTSHGLLAMDDFESAATFAWRSLLVNDTSPAAWNALGIALDRKNMIEDAASAYRKAVILNPSYMPAVFNLAQFNYVVRKDYREAQRLLEGAVSSDTNYVPAFILLARIYHVLGNESKAREYMERGKLIYEKSRDSNLPVGTNEPNR